MFEIIIKVFEENIHRHNYLKNTKKRKLCCILKKLTLETSSEVYSIW